MKLTNIKIYKSENKSPKQSLNVGIQLDSGVKAGDFKIGDCDLWTCGFLNDAFSGAKAGLQNSYSTISSYF